MVVPLCPWPRSPNSLDGKTGQRRRTFERISFRVVNGFVACMKMTKHDQTMSISQTPRYKTAMSTRPGHVQDTSRTRRISFCLCGMGAVRALLQAVRDMDAEKLLEMAADKVKSLRLARGMGKIWKDQTL